MLLNPVQQYMNYYVLQASIPLTYCGMPILLKKELQQKLDRLVE